jgi:hypothetical protein
VKGLKYAEVRGEGAKEAGGTGAVCLGGGEEELGDLVLSPLGTESSQALLVLLMQLTHQQQLTVQLVHLQQQQVNDQQIRL